MRVFQAYLYSMLTKYAKGRTPTRQKSHSCLAGSLFTGLRSLRVEARMNGTLHRQGGGDYSSVYRNIFWNFQR